MSIEWIVPKESIEKACKILDNVPPRNGIKASELIKISKYEKDGALLSLSSDMSAVVLIRTGDPFPFAHDVFLDRRLFFPMVDAGREAKGDAYKFIEKSDGKLIVKTGNRRAIYEHIKPVSGYEDPPDMKSAYSATLEKKWINIVDAARDCATDDPLTPYLNCVFLHPTNAHLEVFASNSFVVFYGKAPKQKTIKQDIAFPLMLIDSLTLENATKLQWTKKAALIEFPKGKMWQAVKIAARKNFPLVDVKKMMKEAHGNETVLAINSSTLAATANRIASYVAALSRDSLIFSFSITKGSRKVAIKSGVSSSMFEETLTMLEPAKQDIQIEWPLEHVIPTLLYIKDDGIAKIKLGKSGQTSMHTNSISLIIARPIKEEKNARKDKTKKSGTTERDKAENS